MQFEGQSHHQTTVLFDQSLFFWGFPNFVGQTDIDPAMSHWFRSSRGNQAWSVQWIVHLKAGWYSPILQYFLTLLKMLKIQLPSETISSFIGVMVRQVKKQIWCWCTLTMLGTLRIVTHCDTDGSDSRWWGYHPPNNKNIVPSHHSNKMSQVPSTSYSCIYIYIHTYIFMNLHLHIYMYMYGKMLSTGPRMSRRTIFGSWVRFGRCSRPSTSMGWQRCTPPKALASMGSSPNSVLLGANEGSWNSWKWKLWRPDQCETLWKSKKNARMMKTKTSSVSLLEWWKLI